MQIQWEVFILRHKVFIRFFQFNLANEYDTTFRLFSFFTLYFKLIMDENTNDTLSLFCFLFLSCFLSKTNYLIQFFYKVFPHNDYPCFLIFNSNPTHYIQDVFFFFLFQQQRKRLIFLFGAIEFAEKVKSLTLRINQ